jgi:hypothetical protein
MEQSHSGVSSLPVAYCSDKRPNVFHIQQCEYNIRGPPHFLLAKMFNFAEVTCFGYLLLYIIPLRKIWCR